MTVPGEYFRFAGRLVRVNWHHEELCAALRPAIAHRAGPEDASELTIDVVQATRPAGMDSPEALQVLESRDGLTVIDAPGGLMSEINLDATRALFACAEPSRLPAAERGAPFRLILQNVLRARDTHLLHAGAVGLPGHGAVLLAAPGGGGKSNTCLACLNSPSLRLLGEDFVAVDNGPEARVWSLYGTAKLHPADVARFPGLAAGVADERDGKAVFNLGRQLGDRFADNLPLRGILVLRITGGPETRIVPAPPGDAARAMLTSLLMVLPASRRPLFEFTTALARRTPVYRLELGQDRGQIAAVIEQFLRQ